jgi:hypothetical protein
MIQQNSKSSLTLYQAILIENQLTTVGLEELEELEASAKSKPTTFGKSEELHFLKM